MSAIVGNTVLSAEVERGRWSGSKGPEAAAIAEASRTALVDRSHPSSELFRPRFVSNDHRRGRKISAVIEAELNHCVSFDFSVAFVTESGLAPLLQTLRELELKGIPGAGSYYGLSGIQRASSFATSGKTVEYRSTHVCNRGASSPSGVPY